MEIDGFPVVAKRNTEESVWCILVFRELNVLPPEVVHHITSFLVEWHCCGCDVRLPLPPGLNITPHGRCVFIQSLAGIARREQEMMNHEAIRVILERYGYN